MNYVEEVEKVETFSNIRYLVVRVSKARALGRNTYETNTVHTRVFAYVLYKFSTGYPHQDKLERSCGNSKKRNDVFVFQAFPYYSLSVECLSRSSAMVDRKRRDEAPLPDESDCCWGTLGYV